MEFKEIVQAHQRMCHTHYNRNCASCRLKDYDDTCHDVPFRYTDEYEKIIEEWLKDNPVLTRRDTFVAKYSDRPWRKYIDSCEHVSCGRIIPCNSCDWWNEEVNQEDEEE